MMMMVYLYGNLKTTTTTLHTTHMFLKEKEATIAQRYCHRKQQKKYVYLLERQS